MASCGWNKEMRPSQHWVALAFFLMLGSMFGPNTSCSVASLSLEGFPCRSDDVCGNDEQGVALICDFSACTGQIQCNGRCRKPNAPKEPGHKEEPQSRPDEPQQKREEPPKAPDEGLATDEPQQPKETLVDEPTINKLPDQDAGTREPPPEPPDTNAPDQPTPDKVFPPMCMDGQLKECSPTPPPNTCKPFYQICQGGAWSSCQEITTNKERLEVCDGKDNDCDGQTDEGCDHIIIRCQNDCAYNQALIAPNGQVHVNGRAVSFTIGAVTYQSQKGYSSYDMDPLIFVFGPSSDLKRIVSFPNQSYVITELTGGATEGTHNYAHGNFDGKLTVGTYTFTGNPSDKAGARDAFVAKVDLHSGAIKWTRSLIGPGRQHIHHNALDSQKNSYYLGYHSNTMTLSADKSSDELTLKNLFSGGNKEGFFASIDDTGKPRWLRHITSKDDSFNLVRGGLFVDDKDNIIVGSYHTNHTVTFGSKEVTAPPGTQGAVTEGKWCALSQWKADGSLTWAALSAVNFAKSKCMIDTIYRPAKSPYFYVGGLFSGDINFFGTQIASNQQSSTNMFIAKMEVQNNQPKVLWVTTSISTEWIYPRDIIRDAKGNIYVVGTCKGRNTFHQWLTIDTNTILSGIYDAATFIAKINDKGKWTWADYSLGRQYHSARSVWIDNQNRLTTLLYWPDNGIVGKHLKDTVKSFSGVSTGFSFWKMPLDQADVVP